MNENLLREFAISGVTLWHPNTQFTYYIGKHFLKILEYCVENKINSLSLNYWLSLLNTDTGTNSKIGQETHNICHALNLIESNYSYGSTENGDVIIKIPNDILYQYYIDNGVTKQFWTIIAKRYINFLEEKNLLMLENSQHIQRVALDIYISLLIKTKKIDIESIIAQVRFAKNTDEDPKEKIKKIIDYDVAEILENFNFISGENITKLGIIFLETFKKYADLDEIKLPSEYGKNEFLKDVFIESNSYDEIIDLIIRNKNVLLQGAPGVGKTFMAKRLAYSIIGNKNDEDQIEFIQFHQSYSYEDFVEGYRPTNNGEFQIEDGIFKKICNIASRDENKDKKYFIIIDEINRGNLSKIFGELLMLIENDKRGKDNKLKLLYTKEDFYVPENLYIIGMLNTADRSLALIDYALRRRFSFYDIKPAFENAKFKEYQTKLNNVKLNKIIELIKKINEEIVDDDTLGDGFEIGHSYFCKFNSIKNSDVDSIIKYEIIPLIKEYWFDNNEVLKKWKDELIGVTND